MTHYRLDMTMMFAMHDAMRRDLAQVTRIASGVTRSSSDDPAHLLRTALGWELFKKFLLVHHQTEDDVLWPALRKAVAGNDDQLALADALEEEHGVIEPLLAAVDAAGADPDGGHGRFADIVDELAGQLGAHLTHEEANGLTLIDASLPAEQWQHFAAVHGQRLTPDADTYMPWLLSHHGPDELARALEKFPPRFANAFREQWAPAFAARGDLWNGR
ncbi:hemerythrin domain-containing protein [Actinacidiphila bryophytorum]|uniref:Hemerythrin domain-containing protein n=1 Tax=Actinacidiphila bryophytorum TaxID=1436133 RepID=A0A9W4E3T0_9ACTN|nr:hemerythrin domain-containing protein [Actinacidiphila bryophytorum]MBM9439722.1 hemerythrin domain-containing protein [Actinacidiphila bryophytorum]MBN6542080.1 hemerythrin domain-containing protein [Actinacidiphila bryophytorum]CAG7605852.1 Hemerythrin domain-containing protein [Actinacidiphila bryophytorum]